MIQQESLGYQKPKHQDSEIDKNKIYSFDDQEFNDTKGKLFKSISSLILKFQMDKLESNTNKDKEGENKEEHRRSLQAAEQLNDSKSVVYMLPVHYSLTVSNVNQIDIENTKADVNGVLTIAVFYGDIQKQLNLDPQILIKSMVVQLSHKQNIALNHPDVEYTRRSQKKMFLFRIRKDFGAIICQDVLFSPFQKLHVIFTLKMQDLNIDFEEQPGNQKIQRPVKIKFNLLKFMPNALMHPSNMGTQIYFADQLVIGEYQVNTKQVFSDVSIYRVPYEIASKMKLKSQDQYDVKNKAEKQIQIRKNWKTKLKKNQKGQQNQINYQFINQMYYDSQFENLLADKQKDEKSHFEQYNQQKNALTSVFTSNKTDKKNYKLRSFNYCHISISMFHHPTVTILSIIFPLITIAFLNLACYSISPKQDQWDVKKLTAIVTSIVAYIGLIPVVRSHIPPTDTPTVIQIMVFIELLPSIGAIIEMLRYKAIYAGSTDPIQIPTMTFQFIILGLVPTGIVVGFSVISLLIYYIRTYICKINISEFKNLIDPGEQENISNRDKWSNIDCYNYLKLIKYKQKQRSNSTGVKN